MPNVSNNGELYAAGQRQLRRVTYPVRALSKSVSISCSYWTAVVGCFPRRPFRELSQFQSPEGCSGLHCTYLFKSVVDDGRQVCLGNFRKHLSHRSAYEIFRFVAGNYWSSVKGLPHPVVGETALKIVFPIRGTVFRHLLQSSFIRESVAKLAAGQIDDFHGEVVSDSMDMVRYLLWIMVYSVLGFGLDRVSCAAVRP